MKILRIRLKNYKGVDACEILPSPTGVTIVEGPNEIGKSSLAEAIDIILDSLDSSGAKEVKATRPVHLDVPTEIEIDIEAGPYAFTYFKRFHKDRATTLRVTRPSPENLGGREAHERVEQILAQTIDAHLWRALRMQQGAAIAQPDMTGQSKLSEHLDRAASRARGGEREESLFEAVQAEYAAYFTESGRELKEFTEAAAAVEQLADEVRTLERTLETIEADALRAAALVGEVMRSGESSARLQANLGAREQEWQGVLGLQSDRARLSADLERAKARVREAEQAWNGREALQRRAVDQLNAHASIAEKHDRETPRFAAAQKARTQAEADLATARHTRDATAIVLDLARRDKDYQEDVLNLQLLQERSERVEKTIAGALDAERVLAETKITKKLLEELQSITSEVERAEARLFSASATVRLDALANLDVVLGGEALCLAEYATLERNVEGKLEILLPGVAEIHVSAAPGAADLKRIADGLRAKQSARLAEADADDLSSAAAALERRMNAERELSDRDRKLKEDLRDLDRATLARKIEGLRVRVAAYSAERRAETRLPADLTLAKAELQQAEQAAKLSEIEWRAAESRFATSEANARELEQQTRDLASQLGMAAAVSKESVKLLDAARGQVGDEGLKESLASEQAVLLVASQVFQASVDKLAAADPDTCSAALANDKLAISGARDKLRALELEQSQLATRLEMRGEEGLGERLSNRQAELARKTSELERRRSLGRAVKLLLDTMGRERNADREAYVAPLKARIEKLGKLVFGKTFEVQLDDELKIVNRTLEGRTVPWTSLSGGTKEVIRLITYLASALILDENDGLPLILDDTLGNTDPERLQKMGLVLSLAGHGTQILILTCVPERFAHVGGARVIRLPQLVT